MYLIDEEPQGQAQPGDAKADVGAVRAYLHPLEQESTRSYGGVTKGMIQPLGVGRNSTFASSGFKPAT